MKRRWFAKEVIQTCESDCAVAGLKCVLDSFEIPNNYEYLRDACQIDINGAAIDRMEAVLTDSGFDCSQMVVPKDQLTLDDQDLFPVIALVNSYQNVPHFVVIWRKVGPWLQIVDPAHGRYWIKASQFVEHHLYDDHEEIDKTAWAQYFGEWQRPWCLRQLAKTLGIDESVINQAMTDSDKGWQPGAKVDAVLRFISYLAKQDTQYTGERATELFTSLMEKLNAHTDCEQWYDIIPQSFWGCRPAEGDPKLLHIHGALILTVKPTTKLQKTESKGKTQNKPEDKPKRQTTPGVTQSPSRTLLNFLRTAGALSPSVVLFSALTITLVTTLQTVSLKMLFEFESLIGPGILRTEIALAIFLLIAGIVILTVPMFWVSHKIARRLENLFRIALYEKLPKLKDEYFTSRLLPDLMERCHAVSAIDKIPKVAMDALSSFTRIIVIFAGLVFIAPDQALLLFMFIIACLAVPFAAQRILSQKDMITRTLAGTLTRDYSNALLGLFTVKVHSGENTILNQQQEALTRWAKASSNERQAFVRLSFVQDIVTYGMVIVMISHSVNTLTASALNILYVYWILKMPARAEQLLNAIQRIPPIRNTVLRLQEPLSSQEDQVESSKPERPDHNGGIHIQCNNASFVAGGKTILQDVNIDIKPGAHIAIVGTSGAGKSTFISSLLGFSELTCGEVLIDGKPHTPEVIANLRRQSSWLDPQVYLFKDSIVENILYGTGQSGRIGTVLDEANLWPLIEGLPNGIHTDCGEAGSKLSGGEGQRIRLARALNKPNVRLAMLDEPFRGLDKPTRMQLMKTVREKWQAQTLICVIHDVSEALQFDQVAVFENGRIVEQGTPDQLLENCKSENSALQRLLDHEANVASEWLRNDNWRRVSVVKGKSHEVTS